MTAVGGLQDAKIYEGDRSNNIIIADVFGDGLSET